MEKHQKVHIIYNAIIFGAIIIVLATIDFGAIPKFVELFVFGLTLTSIALALIVIMYTFFSNNQMTSNITALNKFVNSISTSSQIIKETITGLYEKIDLLPLKIDSVGSRVDEVRSSVEDLKQGYSKDLNEVEQDNIATSEELSNLSDDFYDKVLSDMSNWGISSLYMCSVAHEKQKAFNLIELSEKFDYFPSDYAFGFIIAYSSQQILRVNISGNGSEILNVISFDHEYAVRISGEFQKRIDDSSDSSDSSKDEQRKIRLEAVKNNIDLEFDK